MDLNSKKEILEKIQVYWPDHESGEILNTLNRYGTESYHKEQSRVHLAILKLSNGQLDRLEYFVETARSDYRDVLAWAEYPEEMEIGYTTKNRMTPEEVKQLRIRDREQFLSWLDEEI